MTTLLVIICHSSESGGVSSAFVFIFSFHLCTCCTLLTYGHDHDSSIVSICHSLQISPNLFNQTLRYLNFSLLLYMCFPLYILSVECSAEDECKILKEQDIGGNELLMFTQSIWWILLCENLLFNKWVSMNIMKAEVVFNSCQSIYIFKVLK